MHIDTLFPSNYLKAGDFAGRDFNLTIKALDFQEFDRDQGGKEDRPCLWFEKTEKGLVLNKTNAKMIAELHGPDTDSWVGKTIAVGSEKVPFRGDIVDAIRVRGTVPQAAAAPAAPAAPAAQPQAPAEAPPAPVADAPPYNPKNPFPDPDHPWDGKGDAHDDDLPF